MIRDFQNHDIDTVMKIWLETNTTAHDFIENGYWHSNFDAVKKILPNATIFVYEHNGSVRGFIGLMDSYIAGIFICNELQSKGIGKQLLNYVKYKYNELTLQVFNPQLATDPITFRTHTLRIIEREHVRLSNMGLTHSGEKKSDNRRDIGNRTHRGMGTATQPLLIHNNSHAQILNRVRIWLRIAGQEIPHEQAEVLIQQSRGFCGDRIEDDR